MQSPTWIALSILLADEGRFMQMARRFRHGGSTLDIRGLAVLLLICTLGGLAIWGLSRFFEFRQRNGYHSPRGLFRELCRAHGLDWFSRRLLWQLAQSHRLAQPADLFVEPRRFDNLSGPLAVYQDRFARMRDRLFASDEHV